jgi:hypothetical protein
MPEVLSLATVDAMVPSPIPIEDSGPDVGLSRLRLNETGGAIGWRRVAIGWLSIADTGALADRWRITHRPSPPPDTSIAAGVDLARIAAGELEVRANTDTNPYWGIELYYDVKEHPVGFPTDGWTTYGPYSIETPGTACDIRTIVGLTCGERHVARIRFRWSDRRKLGDDFAALAQYGAEIVGGWVQIGAIPFSC